MSKELKRLAAIILCIMGIVGSLMAVKDRSVQTESITAQITSERSESSSAP